MRVLVEVLYMMAGVAVALMIASLSDWAYPRARGDIWLVAEVAIIATLLMAVGPLRRAVAADRTALNRDE